MTDLEASRSSSAEAHLRLAKGFMESATTGQTSSEFEFRNAFSRAYYALFHACAGYLWAKSDVDVSKIVGKHGSLHQARGKQMGRSFKDFLHECYELRRMADYKPEWQPPPQYWCADRLKQTRRYFYSVLNTISDAPRSRMQ